ncbi:NAD-dependent epimerase/dehydratase family protein [Neptunitalea lumnitzerae]|uniref:NAD-dependent epimerase n=1 Tax=Neptunitalea lumnitzerae TaxID=2965509 RepID=A0ABQ5MGG8_9FLAO|nr:NAD-dependent epimerase/dehydratase family protein [Neptunitalea sp. Y10]GLB48494.1 NAD-dependent epimerase [Neptunitalea sp. Y10]
MILVTGATGMVGAHLVLSLLKEGKAVRALYRSEERRMELAESSLFKSCPEHFDAIEWVCADVRDVPALAEAFVNVKEVYHCAGYISFNPKDYRQLRTVNIEGTANVVNLSISEGVEKLCFISSIATLGNPKNGVISEGCFYNQEEDHNVYAITKYGAEMEVWRASQEGVKVVIVNPGVIFGTGVQSKSMDVFTRVIKGLSYYTEGGSGFVGVADVVKACRFLMNGNYVNQRYVLVSENLPYKTMLTWVATALAVSTPSKKITKGTLKLIQFLDAIKGVFTFGNRHFTKFTVASLDEVTNYSNEKIKETGFQFQPMKEVIETCAVAYK